jgi:hypothetical protein
VTANAQSGDATVSGNTNGGNAKTGDAHAGANIANIVNTNINLSDWFGMLFINVFGSWVGSFGVNTAAGNPVATVNTGSSTAATGAAPQVFVFRPKTPFTVPASATNVNTTAFDSSATPPAGPPAVLASARVSSGASQPHLTSDQNSAEHANFAWMIIGIGAAVSLLGIERYLAFKSRG